MKLRFVKMHGLGNDFVVIDAVHQQVDLDTDQVRALADRHQGIGCDQLLLVEPAVLEEEGTNYLQRLERAQDFHSTRPTFARLATFPNVLAANFSGGPVEPTWSPPTQPVQRFCGQGR